MRKDRRLRVCHVMLTMDAGGAEKLVFDLMETLNNVDFFLFCLDSEGIWYDRANVKARQCADAGEGRGGYWERVRQLVNFVDVSAIDVLHAHTHRSHVHCVLARFMTHVPVVVTFHGAGFYYTRKILWERKLLSYATDRMVAVSEATRQSVCSRTGISPSKITVIRNGIDINYFTPCEVSTKRNIRRQLGIPEDAFVIGTIGRFSPEKNYKMLIRCFAQLRAMYQDVWLIMVGDGACRGDIESEMKVLGVSDYCVLPGIQSNVLPWLHAMDVFCLTSLTEGSSIALLEASSCGLPVVVTNTGGNAEIVKHTLSGFVVPVDDEKAYTDSLKFLFENSIMREQMSNESAKFVRQFYTSEQMAEAYDKLYKDVTGYAE